MTDQNLDPTDLPDVDDSTGSSIPRPTPHPDCDVERNHGSHTLVGLAVAFCEGKREPFVPDYEPLADTRVYRKRLYPNAGGVATVTFRGAADSLWIERGRSGRLSVYSEVTLPSEDEAPLETVLRVAVIPTGKRIPKSGVRLGGANGLHAYLLSRETRVPDDMDLAAQAAQDAARIEAEAFGDDDTAGDDTTA